MTKLNDAGTEKLTVEIPQILYAALRVAASKRRLKVNDIVTAALTKYFKFRKSAA